MRLIDFIQKAYVLSIFTGSKKPTAEILESGESVIEVKVPLKLGRDATNKLKELSYLSKTPISGLLGDCVAFGLLHMCDMFEGALNIDGDINSLNYGKITFH